MRNLARILGAMLIVFSYWTLWDLTNTLMYFDWYGFTLPFAAGQIADPHVVFDLSLVMGLLGYLMMR